MKIAVITGASSGLGEEFARQVVKRYKGIEELWLIARREEKLNELSESINIPCKVLPMDLNNESAIKSYEQLLEDLKPEICVLINSAGYGKIGKFKELDLSDQLGMIDLNIKALIKMTYISLPYLNKKAKILQIASSAGFMPQPCFNVYAATKSFVLNFSRALHYELKEKNITVTAVCPGPVKTEFFDVASDEGKPTLPIKQLTMANAEDVVKKALIDAANEKQVSTYGTLINMFKILSKVVPHNAILPYIKYK